MKPRGHLYITLALICLFLPIGCGPDEATIDSAEAVTRRHIFAINLEESSNGFYKPIKVEYVNIANNINFDKDHVISIVIEQMDRDDSKSQILVSDDQIFYHPREFFRSFICPPRQEVEKYIDDFYFFIKIYSNQFNLFYRVACFP